MVPIPECEGTAHHWFQYSLCRVVLMVVCSDKVTPDLAVVSVLALSSRFDGPLAIYRHLTHQAPVSVLALSSRFDGRFVHGTYRRAGKVSVLALSSRFDGRPRWLRTLWRESVSVLALSSRFDGPSVVCGGVADVQRFSTRSVESF